TGPLVAVFVTDHAVAATARQALRIMAVGFAVAGVAPLVSAYFQSLGRPRPSYVISIGTLVALKAPLVLVLGGLGVTGVWVSLPAGELAAAAIALVMLRITPRG
ncbi:MAG TPA: MATE family efflux transporter, partial [Pseudonocardiaceae bacterium]